MEKKEEKFFFVNYQKQQGKLVDAKQRKSPYRSFSFSVFESHVYKIKIQYIAVVSMLLLTRQLTMLIYFHILCSSHLPSYFRSNMPNNKVNLFCLLIKA